MASVEFDVDDPLTSFVDVWKRVVLEPRRFFAELPREGGLKAPLAFAAASLLAGGVGVLVFGGGLKGMLALLVLGTLRLFVTAGILQVIARNLFDGTGDYEASFRAVAYPAAIAVAIGIPIVKYAAALYGVFLTIVAVERAHGFDAVRATLTLIGTGVTGIVVVYALGLWRTLASLSPLFG